MCSNCQQLPHSTKLTVVEKLLCHFQSYTVLKYILTNSKLYMKHKQKPSKLKYKLYI